LEKQAEIDMLSCKFIQENKALQTKNNNLIDELQILAEKF